MIAGVVVAFAGGGGSSVGVRDALPGVPSVHVEWDASACATLRAAGFGRVVQGDVRDYRPNRHWRRRGWPEASLFWGSPPCQDFSTAGKRVGASGSRNGWPWTLDMIDALKPRWVICENVPGLLMHSGENCGDPALCPGCYWLREVVPAFVRRFAAVDVRTLDSADYGVPQHRKRVFLVAGPRRIRWPQPTHADATMAAMFGRLPWVSMREALHLDAAVYAEGGDAQSARNLDPDAPTTLSVAAGNALPHVVERPPAWYRASHASHASRTIGTKANASILDAPAPAVTTTEEKGTRASAASGGEFNGGPDRASDALYAGCGRRRLSVLECSRLQDFPVACRTIGYCQAHAATTTANAGQGLQRLREAPVTEALEERQDGGSDELRQADALQRQMLRGGKDRAGTAKPGDVIMGIGPQVGASCESADPMSALRLDETSGSPPQGRGLAQQRPGEHRTTVPILSHTGASIWADPSVSDLLFAGDGTEQRSRILPEALPALSEVGKPAGVQAKPVFPGGDSGRLVCPGGGHCAHPRDWPFQGTKSSQYAQVGNAVPPRMARLLVEAVVAAEEAA